MPISAERRQAAGTVDDGEHLNRVGTPSIDHAIGTLNDFPNVRSLVLRDFAARIGELGELTAAMPNAVDDTFGIDRGGLGDVLVDGRELLEGALGPEDAHYAERFFPRPSRARTSS